MNGSAAPVRVSREDGITEGVISEWWRVGEHDVLIDVRNDRAYIHFPYITDVSKERQERSAEKIGVEFEFTYVIDGEIIVIPYDKVVDFLIAVDL